MEYYILTNGEKQGPFSLEQLREQMITRETMVWRAGLDEWMPACKVYELADLLRELPPDIPREQPSTMPHTWLAESILVTIFCCLPLGIVGIVYAAKVEARFLAGQYELAQEYSRKARLWTLVGLCATVIPFLIYLAVIAIAGIGAISISEGLIHV